MSQPTPTWGALLTPREVADLFRVDPKTVQRWARSGKLPAVRTLGGQLRFREDEVRQVLGALQQLPQPRAIG